MTLSILLYFIYLFSFILIIKKAVFFKIPGIPPIFISVFFVLKILVGFILWWFYSNHTARVNADIFKYFDDSLFIYKGFKESPFDFFRMIFEVGEQKSLHIKYYDFTRNWYKPFYSMVPNDNRAIIKLNALLRITSNGNYHIHSLFLNFLSFTGILLLYKSFCNYLYNKKLLFLCLTIVPSVLFWSSGNLKESILILNLGIFIYSLFKIKTHFKKRYFITFILSLYLFFYIKIYVLLALVPASIGYLLVKNNLKLKPSLLVFMAVNITLLISSFFLGVINKNLSVLFVIQKKQGDFIRFAESTDSGSFFSLSKLESTPISFIINIPEALTNSILRPFVWEANNILTLISSIENVCILAFASYCLISFKKKNLNYGFLFFLINIWFTTYLIIGYTTPVWGAISRYKIIALPFFLISLLYLMDIKKKEVSDI